MAERKALKPRICRACGKELVLTAADLKEHEADCINQSKKAAA